MSDPFETFIESQLQQHLGPLVGSAVAPHAGRFVAAAVGAGVSATAGGGALAALTTKTAAVVAAGTLVAGGGGAVAATVATGSPDPAVWTRDASVNISTVVQAPPAPAPPAAAPPARVPAAATLPPNSRAEPAASPDHPRPKGSKAAPSPGPSPSPSPSPSADSGRAKDRGGAPGNGWHQGGRHHTDAGLDSPSN